VHVQAETLRALASLVGVAVENARLFDELRYRRDLLAWMVHDLRNPITSVSVNASLLLERAEAEQRQTLTALGFRLEGNLAYVPSWRPDVMGEADLVEEVARIASLTKLEGKPMRRMDPGVPKPILSPMQRRERAARRTAAALGYNECVTYSFIDKASATLFAGGDDATMLANPISADMSHMRPLFSLQDTPNVRSSPTCTKCFSLCADVQRTAPTKKLMYFREICINEKKLLLLRSSNKVFDFF